MNYPKMEKPKVSFRLIFYAVALPVISMLVELTTRVCRDNLFDPLPTLWHCFVFALVPVGYGYVIYWLKKETPAQLQKIVIANGIALGVSLYYSVLFLPILPISVIALLGLIGLCGLCPFIAVYSGWQLHKRLRKIRAKSDVVMSWRVPALSMVAGFCLLVFADLSYFATDVGVSLATSETPEKRARGLRFLERFGNEDMLSQRSGGRQPSGVAYSFLGGLFFNRPNRETYRELLFRLSGRTYEVVQEEPRGFFSAFSRAREPGNLWRSPELELSASQIDGSVDANGMAAYMEWTMTFENKGWFNKEARSLIQLPPGAVVSRLTLWVNGEPREAAFAGRSQVTEAYNSVVSKRRDPVLVTTRGLDRIFVQCFPVMPRIPMKIRIGISLPLRQNQKAHAALPMPYMLDRNFELSGSLEHAVWIESKTPLQAAGPIWTKETTPGGHHALRASLPAGQEQDLVSSVEVARTNNGPFWSYWRSKERLVSTEGKDDTAPRYYVGSPVISEPVGDGPIIVVLDGSAGMAERWQDVLTVLGNAGTGVTEVIVASESVEHHPFTGRDRKLALETLEKFEPEKGRDNVAALTQAWQQLASQPNSRIVWFHAQQPYLLSSMSRINQLRARRPGVITLIDAPLTIGPNSVISSLDDLEGVLSVPLVLHQGDSFWQRTSMAGTSPVVVKRSEQRPAGHQTSDHLARLWANQQIGEHLRAGSKDRESLIALAQEYQLVTPISGAVVLETAAQYEAAGLNPVKVQSVPTIPEPETWLLIVVVLLALVILLAKRRPWQTINPA